MSILKHLESLPLLGLVLFLFSTGFPPFDLLTQINLPIHMAQHALIVFSGVLIAHPFYVKMTARGKNMNKSYAITSIAAISIIVVFWHLPFAWDAAVLNPVTHSAEHLSFLAVGMLIGLLFPALPDNFKFISVFLAASGHMAYGIYLFIMNTPVYPLYPSVGQQALLGIFMLFPSPVYFIGLMVFSLTRETKRLEELEFASLELNKRTPIISHQARSDNPRIQISLKRSVVPLTTVVLIATFVGYLIVTAGVIYSSSAADPIRTNEVIVYIEETPITWQYSPQNTTVVIGVNNTVTWVSHSLSEDTVTSNSGLFSSGVLRPGESWSFTFSHPGVYNYACSYHPWMKGSITVLEKP
jgi:plastocyanin